MSRADDRTGIRLREQAGIDRKGEPVHVALERRPEDEIVVVDEQGTIHPAQMCGSDLVVLADVGAYATVTLRLGRDESPGPPSTRIDASLPPDPDWAGLRRVDTGTYTVELGAGRADGRNEGKWGLRRLERADEGVNLIEGNSFGGVYGPFFTVENGFVGAQNVCMQMRVIAEGPVCCAYELYGVYPDGRDSNVSGKTVRAQFFFYAGCDWFRRRYFIDDYETAVWGRTVSGLVTVGDETGAAKQGQGVFQEAKFYSDETGPTTCYVGDPPRGEQRSSGWIDLVDNDVWPHNVDALACRNRHDGFAMIWAFDRVITCLQVDHRLGPPNGGPAYWFNVGTNAYKEIPCLPNGSVILTAYGRFDDIDREVRKMRSPLAAEVLNG